MKVTLGKNFSPSKAQVLQYENQVNLTIYTHQYNQYLHTQMLQQEEKYLINQQKIEKINHRNFERKDEINLSQQKKRLKVQKFIKMPIPLFQMDRVNQFDSSYEIRMKNSLGVQKQNSFLIGSQLSNKTFYTSNSKSISTQTEDFTFMTNILRQAKIYEIPVEMQIKDQNKRQQKGIQVSQRLQSQLLFEFQHPNPAILRQNNLLMQSGVISMSIQNYSFSRKDLFQSNQNHFLTDREIQNQNGSNDEQNQFQQDQELLLQEGFDQNKTTLFQTARFHSHINRGEFIITQTPPKQTNSGTQSSPQTTGLMRLSEREINMMQMISTSTNKIDEQEYQHLQSKFYILQQQNIDKNDQIEMLYKKIEDLQKQTVKLQQFQKEKILLEQNYKKTEKQLRKKCQQLEKITYTLDQLQKQVIQNRQKHFKREEKIEEILIQKQNYIQSLEKQINLYRDQLTSQQQRFNKQNQAIQSLIHQKNTEIKQLKNQYDRKYDIYIVSIKEMKQKITNYELKMEQLQSNLNKKNIKIKQLKDSYIHLKQQNSILCQKIANMKHQINRSSSFSSSTQNHNSQNCLIKGQNKYDMDKINNYNYFRNHEEKSSEKGTIMSGKIIQEKEKESQSNQKLFKEKSEFSINQDISSQQPHHNSNFATYSFRKQTNQLGIADQSQYIHQLQKVILMYQKIILDKISTIQELEQKVVQFLKDALTKQNQAELLYSQLCQYENNINGLLVQKLDLQLENQRLKKMICDSQNKLSILGNRLIKLAKTNSTISFLDRGTLSSSSSLEQGTK